MAQNPQPWSTHYVSLRAAADALGLSERAVRRYISEGLLPAYRLGPRQIRIKTADLDSLMQRIPTTDPAA